MRFLDTLASYLPSLIVHHLVENDQETSRAPTRQTYDTVCLFCDVSGFTALSEAMEQKGEGAEGLAMHLNSYFSLMCRLIAADGGDVFKFAGDACIVLWPNTDTMDQRLKRAVQCAYAIQDLLDDAMMGDMVEKGNGEKTDVQLSVKCGIGMGNVSVLHIGGVLGRMEYLAVGEPLLQAFQAEHHASPGQIIVSEEAWKCLDGCVNMEEKFHDNYVRLQEKLQEKLVRKKNMMNQMHKDDMDDVKIEAKIKQYITGAVLPNLNPDSPEDEKWGNELRKVCVMFVNLGIKEQQLLAAARYEEAMKDVHEVLCEVQKSVYQYEGAINKFLMDDKGSTLIACFGLPPGAHEDDCERGVLAALKVCEKLYDRGLSASCGLTFGEVFCGIIGNRVRREFTVLGDCVNLSARLMQQATSEGGGVLCDSAVVNSCGASLLFTELDSIRVKGKSQAVKIYRPYPPDRDKYPKPQPAHHGGPNLYEPIYTAQKEYYTAHRTLTFLQVFLRHNSKREKNLRENQENSRKKHKNVSENLYGSGKTAFKRYNTSGSDVVMGSTNLGSTSFGPGEDTSGDARGVRQSFVSNGSAKSRRNSVLTMKKGMDDPGASPGTKKHRQPRICRPTLTPSGLIPIHHALSSGGVNLIDRLSSINDRSDSINSEYTDAGDIVTGGELSIVSKSIDYCIVVTVPVRLRIDNLRMDSPTLPPINMNDVSDFKGLEHKVVKMAIQAGLMSHHDGKDRVVLNVMGTRCFLPEENFDIKYLPAFVACFFDSDLAEEDIEMMIRGSDLMGQTRQSSLSSATGLGTAVSGSPPREGSSGRLRKTYELTLMKEMEKLNVQNRLGVVRSKLLEKKIRLVDEGKGGVMVIEGEPGCGKTELLASFVARTLPNTAATYVTHGAPFCGHVKPFGVWGVIVQQYLDLVMTNQARDDPEMQEKIVNGGEEGRRSVRTQVFLQELQKSFKGEGGRHKWLLSCAYLLNDLCNCDAPKPDSTDNDPPPDAAKIKLIQKAMLFRFIRRLAAYKSSIIIFDDAMYLSHDSWSLAVAVTNLITASLSSDIEPVKLLLIFSLRPMSNYRSRYEMMSVDYEDLVDADQINFVKLGGMPPEDVEEFVCNLLGPNVEEISENLFRFLEERAIGNPFIASEMVNALESKRGALTYERVDKEGKDDDCVNAPQVSRRGSIAFLTRGSVSGGSPDLGNNMALAKMHKKDNFFIKVDLDKDFDLEKDVPPLQRVMALQGARLDRLNACQQGILKVASVIAKFYQEKDPKLNDGLTFRWSALEEIYPVKGHKNHLWKELEALDDNGVLMQTKKERNELTKANDFYYRFSFEAMCDCVMSRLLKDHKIQLEEAVAKYDANCEKARRQMHMKLMTQKIKAPDGSGVVTSTDSIRFHSGPLHIQRRTTQNFLTMRGFKRKVQAGGEWKDRYCVLKPDGMYMYREEGETDHTQIIYLEGAKAEIEKKPETQAQYEGNQFVFKVEAKSWEKNNKRVDNARTFNFSTGSKAEMDSWIYYIRYVTESIEVENAKNGRNLGSKNKTMSRRSLGRTLSKRLTAHKSLNTDYTADDPETLEGEGDMRLVVTVKRGTQLINPEAFGTSNPYCELTLDDQHCRTRTPKSSSVNPIWDETFNLPLDLHQWVNSGLKIQIWNRDVYLSDDFLGYCDIDLAELVPEDLPPEGELEGIGEDDEHGSPGARRGSIGSMTTDEEVKGLTGGEEEGADAKGKSLWLKLIPKKKYQIARGEILIHVYLLMPDATRDRCKEAGGWEKFKMQLQTEVLESGFKGKKEIEMFQTKAALEKEITERRELSTVSFEELLELTSSDVVFGTGGGEGGEGGGGELMAEGGGEGEKEGEEEEEEKKVDPKALEVVRKRMQSLGEGGSGKPFMQHVDEKAKDRDTYSQHALNKMADHGDMRMKHALSMPFSADDTGIDSVKRVIHNTSEGLQSVINKIKDHETEGGKSGGEEVSIAEELEMILDDVKALDNKEIGGEKSNPRSRWNKLRGLATMVGSKAGHTAELDESDKKWLTANYTRETVEDNNPKNQLPRSASYSRDHDNDRASPKSTASDNGSVAGYQKGRSKSGGRRASAHRSSSPLDTEAFLHAMVSGLEEGDDETDFIKFHYKDENGGVQGPFRARDLFYWFDAGYIHEQVLVSVGESSRSESNPSGAPFVPFSIFLDTLKGNFVHSSVGNNRWAGSANIGDIFKDPEDITRQHWNWNFRIFNYQEDELVGLGMDILESLNVPNVYNVTESSFIGFMDNVRYLMTRNELPYHNYYHALDVMQTSFVFIESLEANMYVTELESFGLVIAALCHDLDHPGLNNSYQVNRQTPLALRFNDASCLENMHSALCFSILRKSGCDIFSGIDETDQASIRKVIIGCIINTDMTYHFALKSDLTNMIEKTKSSGNGVLTFMREDKDRDILLKTILHVADISNPCKSFELSKRWSDAVIQEFFMQGDLEKKEGLSVSMGCDRNTTQQETLSLNFCDFIVAPFFFALQGLFPKLDDVIVTMSLNRKEWHKRAAESIREKVFERGEGGGAEGEANDQEIMRVAELMKWDKRAAIFDDLVKTAMEDKEKREKAKEREEEGGGGGGGN